MKYTVKLQGLLLMEEFLSKFQKETKNINSITKKNEAYMIIQDIDKGKNFDWGKTSKKNHFSWLRIILLTSTAS